MNPMRLAAALLLLCLMAGCISYTKYEGSLKPVSPKPHAIQFYHAVRVDSLQPTFKWHAADPNQKVDLAIWEAVYKGKGMRSNTSSYDKGSLVYHKEGIVGGEHLIETKLAPDTIYFWSIKPTESTNWATAEHSAAIGNTYENATGLFFAIQTPPQQ